VRCHGSSRRAGDSAKKKGFKAAQDEIDFQLGNPLILAQVILWQWFTMRFLSENEDYKWLASDQLKWLLINFQVATDQVGDQPEESD